jgi:hypothetical protein
VHLYRPHRWPRQQNKKDGKASGKPENRRLFTHQASGFGVHRGGPQAATKKKSKSVKTKTTKRKISSHKPAQSTMDMIRTVLENKGEALSAQEIREAVKETFGLEPSKSYAQMLYKRAKAGTGFFKSGNRYGLVSGQKPAKEDQLLALNGGTGWPFPGLESLTDY